MSISANNSKEKASVLGMKETTSWFGLTSRKMLVGSKLPVLSDFKTLHVLSNLGLVVQHYIFQKKRRCHRAEVFIWKSAKQIAKNVIDANFKHIVETRSAEAIVGGS